MNPARIQAVTTDAARPWAVGNGLFADGRLFLTYTLLVLGATLALVATLAITVNGDTNGRDLVGALAVFAAMVVARRFPLTLRPGAAAYMDTAVVLAAVLILPPLAAVAAVAAGMALGEFVAGTRGERLLFHFAARGLEVAAGSLVYAGLQPNGLDGDSATMTIGAVVVTASLIYLLNAGLTDSLLLIQSGFKGIGNLLKRHALDLPQQAAFYYVGAIAAAVAEGQPLTTILFLLIPTVLAYISIRDSTHLRVRLELEGRLERQAFYDALTGLPNRPLFMDRLQHAIDASTRSGSALAVLFIDLDRFKTINDTLGHSMGDQLLVATSLRLSAVLRPGDTVARLGGDEFTILLHDIHDELEAVAIAERILTVLSDPLTISGHQTSVLASIGIAVARPRQGEVLPGELLRHADIAMYSAKQEGRFRCAVYRPEMDAQALEKQDLEGDLRRALDSAGLAVYYQPEVDLRTGQIVAAEALARWQHPEKGFVPPSEFIKLAEESGLIVPLGRWIMTEACRQAVTWQTLCAQDRPIKVSVNVAGRQLADPAFPDELREILQETRLHPSLLRLEVSDRIALAETPTVVAALHRVRQLGVGLAIDDFASGQSSLAYLTQLEVDLLKIDRSLIAGINDNDRRRAIVKALIALSHELGIKATAEGVESTAELSVLRELGCDRAQGFLLARPLTQQGLGRLIEGSFVERIAV